MLFHVDRNRESISPHAGVRLDFLVPYVLKSCEGVSTGHAEEQDRSDQSREPNSKAALLDGLSPILPTYKSIGRNKNETKTQQGDGSLGH